MPDPDSHPNAPILIDGVEVPDLAQVIEMFVRRSQDSIIVCDPDRIITHWSPRATELYGYRAEEAIGRSPNFLMPDDLADEAEELTADAADGQLAQEYITTRQRKDGRLVHISLTIASIIADDGRVLATVGLARDISAMMQIQSQFVESERRMNEAQALAHIGSWDWDLMLEFPTWTQELSLIYGYPLEHVPSAEDLLARVSEGDREMVAQKIAEAKTGVDNTVEYRIELPTGALRYAQARHHSRIDEDGEPIGVHGVVQDVTERKHYEAELERLATHDVLTGLPNRRTFDQRLELEIARCRRDGILLTLAIIDIDKFKRINDTFGHPAGDSVLARVGELFAAQVREDELMARVGGEEFAWILHGTDSNGAWIAVERARTVVANEEFPEVGRVTMSAGICTLTPEMDGAGLYRSADLALLEAKRSGRDRVLTAADAIAPAAPSQLVA